MMNTVPKAAALIIFGGACVTQAIYVSAQTLSASKHERPWTPADSVSVRYISWDMDDPRVWFQGKPYMDAWFGRPDRNQLGIVFSPDQKFFFALSYHGDVQKDREIWNLHVFKSDDVVRALNRRPLLFSQDNEYARATMWSSKRSQPGIRGVRWDPASRSILFAGMDGGEIYRPYRLNVETRQIERLGKIGDEVGWFDYRGRRLLYTANHNPGGDERVVRYPMDRVDIVSSGSVLPWVVRGFNSSQVYAAEDDLGVSSVLRPFDDAALSPDGNAAVVYQASSRSFSLLKFSDDGTEPLELMKIEGEVGSLQRKIFWSSDGRWAVILGVAGRALKQPAQALIATYKVATREWEMIAPMEEADQIESVSWDEGSNKLSLSRLSTRGEKIRVEYQRIGQSWQSKEVRETAEVRPNGPQGLFVEIRQSENDPPKIVASARGRALDLIEPDQALEHVDRIPVQRFSWRDFDGERRTGGLLLPRTFRRGNPIPVVIQPYYYLPDIFLPDGQSRTADSAQALAARGIAVLVIDTGDLMDMSARLTVSEGPDFVRRVDSIVDALVEQKIADPTKIGLVGFSRGGYQAHFAITHPQRTCIGAAVLGDSFTASYPMYLTWTGTGIPARSFMSGGKSFWRDPGRWLSEETTFNVDLVQSPALFTYNNYGTSSGKLTQREIPQVALEAIGAFYMNRKPFESLHFPIGVHQLATPLERVAMMSSVVDWMAFWLLGTENAEPSKAVQNERWRKIRSDWAAARENEPARGKTGFITTRSGLQYSIHTRTQNASPQVNEVALIHYVGTRLDGTEFVNTLNSGMPRVFQLSGKDFQPVRRSEIDVEAESLDGSGWDEALRYMHVGEKATIFMPSRMSFRSDGAMSSTEEPLKFEVELVGVKQAYLVDALTKAIEDEGLPAAKALYAKLMLDGFASVQVDERNLLKAGEHFLYAGRKLSEAQLFFDAAVAAFPNSSNGHILLAERYLQGGEIKEASRQFEIALSLDPTIDNGVKKLAEKLRMNRNYTASLERLRLRVQKWDGGDAEQLQELGGEILIYLSHVPADEKGEAQELTNSFFSLVQTRFAPWVSAIHAQFISSDSPDVRLFAEHREAYVQKQ